MRYLYYALLIIVCLVSLASLASLTPTKGAQISPAEMQMSVITYRARAARDPYRE